MTVILGLDAAWTPHQPSGVAVVASTNGGWRCHGVAPSYDAFLGLADGRPVDWGNGKFKGCAPDVPALLQAAEHVAGAKVDVIAIDMPVATVPITGRRVADDLISTAFGNQGCSTHSPTPVRPGALGANLTTQSNTLGYPIAHAGVQAGTLMRLIEVYPHPALLVLMNSQFRVPYKVSKSSKYQREASICQRIANLLNIFRQINNKLAKTIQPTGLRIPDADVHTLAHLKRYEDALDALISAWVGIHYINGTATAYGDATAAIWCPNQAPAQVSLSP